jgi:hypothetical protein
MVKMVKLVKLVKLVRSRGWRVVLVMFMVNY